ncbi:hypothetical protein [Sphingomonas albertensis]|uniref:hypothetical protein n=1 Tax=Sphingomonas albertensis TaxID=2762591 RepID=UPI0037D9CB61
MSGENWDEAVYWGDGYDCRASDERPFTKLQASGLGSPQPAQLAPAYVLLASKEGSYMTGAVIAVTDGVPIN